MASDGATLEYVTGQIRIDGLTSRKMFGEYSLYVGGKIVALIADNQLFVKPTEAGRALIGAPVEAPPYPGAKNYFLADEYLDDAEFITKLIRVTEAEVPLPKPKKEPKAKKKPR
jgi:TfoX/Sxy family transcriptional regulator of competence genes